MWISWGWIFLDRFLISGRVRSVFVLIVVVVLLFFVLFFIWRSVWEWVGIVVELLIVGLLIVII